ncbi:radical SAM protein [Candidatus Falkowbacteria bacterium]|nr:radical SAM protein [Candidatus Falkowbacteria bacterium]
MDFKKLHNIVIEMNLPAYREKQIRQAFWRDLAGGWNEVTVLPKELREKLAGQIKWDSVEVDKIMEDGNSIKARLKLSDGNVIESVLIKYIDGPSTSLRTGRNTVCVSSQVGCPMDCSFCATGRGGFKRNLESEEIVEQVLFFARMMKNNNFVIARSVSDEAIFNRLSGAQSIKDRHALVSRARDDKKNDYSKVTNVVFMGMGEPFLNYDNVMKAIKMLNDKEGFNLGARHISISTCGIAPGIRKLAGVNLQINLALSLHAPDDKLRDRLMPVNKKYPLQDVLATVDFYIKKTNRRVMIEYALIDGVNDGEAEAKELAYLIKSRPLCYVNIIPYNPVGGHKRSGKENIKKFIEILEKNKVKYTIRRGFGGSINAACGQLAGEKNKLK